MKATAIIDWLTFSVAGETEPERVITDILRMDKLLFEKGYGGGNGYCQSLQYENIRVFFDPAEDRIADMGICVSMSGKGCRHWEMLTEHKKSQRIHEESTPFMSLFQQLHIDERVNVSRVDLALDDTQGLLDLDVICNCVELNNINSRIRKRSYTLSWDGQHPTGKTVYIGAPSSDFRMRIYDKAKEMYQPGEAGYDKHWVRFEIVMKGANANGFVNCMVNANDLGPLASGILQDKIAFIERDNENITRCSICQWWLDFVDAVAAVKLVFKEEVRHKLEDRIDWVSRQIAPSLSLINDACGYFKLRDIIKIGAGKRSKQQQAELDSYRKAYHIVPRDAR